MWKLRISQTLQTITKYLKTHISQKKGNRPVSPHEAISMLKTRRCSLNHYRPHMMLFQLLSIIMCYICFVWVLQSLKNPKKLSEKHKVSPSTDGEESKWKSILLSGPFEVCNTNWFHSGSDKVKAKWLLRFPPVYHLVNTLTLPLLHPFHMTSTYFSRCEA